MTNYILGKNPDCCVDCGLCEVHLPGLLAKMTANRLLIGEAHLQENHPAIQAAIDSCRNGALTLEELQ
jgi:hypothetical protein